MIVSTNAPTEYELFSHLLGCLEDELEELEIDIQCLEDAYCSRPNEGLDCGLRGDELDNELIALLAEGERIRAHVTRTMERVRQFITDMDSYHDALVEWYTKKSITGVDRIKFKRSCDEFEILEMETATVKRAARLALRQAGRFRTVESELLRRVRGSQ